MDTKPIEIDLEVNAEIEKNRLSFAERANDILRRMLLPHLQPARTNDPEHDPANAPAAAPLATAYRGGRTTGRWTVEVSGQRQSAPSLKAAYREALLLLSERYPDFLEKFSQEGSRSRKFVARNSRELYLTSPNLAAKHAAALTDGWFFDTNLSTDQVARRIRVAARICGLTYGKDFQLLNNFEQI